MKVNNKIYCLCIMVILIMSVSLNAKEAVPSEKSEPGQPDRKAETISQKPVTEKKSPVPAAGTDLVREKLLNQKHSIDRDAKKDFRKQVASMRGQSLFDKNASGGMQQKKNALARSAGNSPKILTGHSARLHERRLNKPSKNVSAPRQSPVKQSKASVKSSAAEPAVKTGVLLKISADKQIDPDVRMSAIRQMGRDISNKENVTQQLTQIVHDQDEDPQVRREALLSILKCNRMLLEEKGRQ